MAGYHKTFSHRLPILIYVRFNSPRFSSDMAHLLIIAFSYHPKNLESAIFHPKTRTDAVFCSTPQTNDSVGTDFARQW